MESGPLLFPSSCRATLVNKRNIVVKVARCAHRCAEAQIHDFSQCRHRREKNTSLFKTRYEMSGSLNTGSAEGESFV